MYLMEPKDSPKFHDPLIRSFHLRKASLIGASLDYSWYYSDLPTAYRIPYLLWTEEMKQRAYMMTRGEYPRVLDPISELLD